MHLKMEGDREMEGRDTRKKRQLMRRVTVIAQPPWSASTQKLRTNVEPWSWNYPTSRMGMVIPIPLSHWLGNALGKFLPH